MKKAIKILVSVLLIAVLVFGVAYLYQLVKEDDEVLANISENLTLLIPDEAVPAGNAPSLLDTDPNVQTLLDIDLDALKEVNSEVIGWILIPGTNINFALMQGEVNDEYLYHTWDHQLSSEGSVYMDSANTPAFTDFNTVIYGQNAIESSVFYDLQMYRHQMFWQANPYVYIRTADHVYRFEIFSSYVTEVDGTAYNLEFTSDEARWEFVSLARESSVISAKRTPSTTDQFLTLSTCINNADVTRLVVQACLDATMAIEK